MNKALSSLSASMAVILASISHAHSLEQVKKAARESSTEPWEISYVLFVAPTVEMRKQKLSAQRLNRRMASNERLIYMDAKALLAPSYTIGPVAVTLLRFTPQGRVLDARPPLSNFTARRTKFDRMVFMKTKGRANRHLYHFADWYEDGLESPAICTLEDADRYDEVPESGSEAGYFGCVEWAKQLYKTEQAYIDVTTHTTEGSFIGGLMGWARYSDQPKPVIGLHDETWMCLHNCPTGEKPGVIQDIAVWSKIHGFPLPVQNRDDDD